MFILENYGNLIFYCNILFLVLIFLISSVFLKSKYLYDVLIWGIIELLLAALIIFGLPTYIEEKKTKVLKELSQGQCKNICYYHKNTCVYLKKICK